MSAAATVTDIVLTTNIQRTLKDVVRLLNNADAVNTSAKTVYYQAIILRLASVVEALAYHFMDRHCAADPTLLSKNISVTWKLRTTLSQTELATTKQLYIAERIETPMTFRDCAGSFKTINTFLKQRGLIDLATWKKLDYARKKRNEIHLQTLDTTSRSYTLKMVDRIADGIAAMYTALDTCP